MKLKIIMALAVLFMSSGLYAGETPQIVTRFNELADKVEREGGSYTEKQWKHVNAQLDTLAVEYDRQKDRLTSQERKSVNDAMGRYRAAVAKSDFDSAKDAVTGTYRKVAESTSEAFSEVKGFFKGLGKKKKK